MIPYQEKSSRNPFYIDFERFSDTTRSLANTCGVPRLTMMQKPFLVSEVCRTIEAEVGGTAKILSSQKQLASFGKFMRKPSDPAKKACGIYCISSMPNDARAASVAAHIVLNMIERLTKTTDSKPLWYQVMGDYRSAPPAKPMGSLRPSLLVLSNVPANATAQKLERLRDLLEQYDDIPRLVVSTGTDPITFFSTRLYYQLTAALFLSARNRVWTV